MGVGDCDTLSAASRVGPYEVVGFLGRGATANVYHCRHVTLGRSAAVKVLHPHLARDPIAAARFLREGRALSRLNHPNIIDVLDVGNEGGVPYLVTSLVDGVDLGQHLRAHHPVALRDIADCVLLIVSAMSSSHEAGVIHRDLKPSNILLTRDRLGTLVPKVLDFGVSKLSGSEATTELTETDGTLGTASYMAPEQLRSSKQVDGRCDVYSLGVIVYEWATGQRPFRGKSRYDVMHAVLTAPVAPPSRLRSDIPSSFDAVVLKAMRRDPTERFASAADLGLALAPFAANPERWAREFAGRTSSQRVPAASPSPSEASTLSFTLASERHARHATGVGRARLVLADVVVLGIVGATFAVAVAFARAPASSQRVSAATSPEPPVAALSASASMAPLAAPVVEPSIGAPTHAPPAARPHDASRAAPPSRPATPSVLDAPPLISPGRPPVQFGTNGAPVLD